MVWRLCGASLLLGAAFAGSFVSSLSAENIGTPNYASSVASQVGANTGLLARDRIIRLSQLTRATTPSLSASEPRIVKRFGSHRQF